ncbi:Stomatin-like protein 2, mitochondrial [Capsicum baccatum]|uniref:Stomatin-like protein 2, mitochondrial n=1 Tax=Capsicum baccatum TaxID=33114 RepID=A0A2G2V9K1_CAPBA|nr:Stomatin-like protein 2, mitochondrial [Capsicum baccatum]
MDGVLYIRIIDPVLASYGTEDPVYSVVQLAQTTMRSELGKITLDKTFEERVELNRCILNAINDWPLRTDWGLECLRYEIKDITPPKGVKVAMEKQAEAEHKKRAKVLISEGQRQASVNVADGKKMAVILESEAAKMDQVNRAKGEADAIFANAQATARAITEVSRAIHENGGADATSLRVAEQYVEVFEKINKSGTVMLFPQDAGDTVSLISQAVAIHSKLSTSK